MAKVTKKTRRKRGRDRAPEPEYGHYGTAQDLAAKIEWEGGPADFFCHYAGWKEFVGTPIGPAVKEFVEAYNRLTKKLEEAGVVYVEVLDESAFSHPLSLEGDDPE